VLYVRFEVLTAMIMKVIGLLGCDYTTDAAGRSILAVSCGLELTGSYNTVSYSVTMNTQCVEKIYNDVRARFPFSVQQ
jgi:hypothetical protein